jgi:dihydroxyacetone kinase
VLVHKLAGAAAEEGRSLDEVTRVAKLAADSVRTMGVALRPCIVPAVGKPTFTLPPNGTAHTGVLLLAMSPDADC